MRCLYIDTSSSFLYAGIVNEGKLEAEIKKEYGHKLSEMTWPEMATMFENCKITAKDINKIIVVNGPGSFTGIRIGITIAKVYAWSLNIPITTITSLEAMAISSDIKSYKVPMIDARRKYVFAAIYDQNNKEILKPSYLKIEDLNKELEKIEEYSIITNDKIKEYEQTISYSPDILKIVNTFKDKKEISPHAINPDYLKLTEAEESKM